MISGLDGAIRLFSGDEYLISPHHETLSGWSALHFREGDDKQCSHGTIKNNEIVSYASTAIDRAFC